MSLRVAIRLLKEAALVLDARVGPTKWYIFGSGVRAKALPRDLDVLIIYESAVDAELLRKYLRGIVLPIPLHLLLLTRDEERQFDFIATQGARPLRPLLRVAADRKMGRSGAGGAR